MNIPDIRLLNQQLSNPLMSDVHDLVSWMGMLQAQEYTMMRWAVGIRLKRPSMKAFREAYDSGRIIRTHLFRCTWQLVAAEDVRWMLKLCAHKNRRAVTYYGHGISEKDFLRANELICQVLAGHPSMTKDILLSRLAERGLTGDPHAMSIYLRRAELDGIACSGKLDDRQNTYALLEERVPQARELTREESVGLLARKYFRSHSPATLEDFVWWSNLNTGECRAGIEAITHELNQEQYGGQTYYVHQDCRTKGCRKKTLLLPSYDEYLLGYKSRHHAIEKDFCPRAYNRNGTFYPVIVQHGQVVGNWHPKKGADFFKDEYRMDISGLLKSYAEFADK